MKEFTLNYANRTKQENCYQDPKSKNKTILFKKMVELPHIWKKSKLYKSKNEIKLPICNDGSFYFLPSNQTTNLYQKVSLTEINPTLGKANEWSNVKSVINSPIHINPNGSDQNLLDTGIAGGFEYWDGDLIELPN